MALGRIQTDQRPQLRSLLQSLTALGAPQYRLSVDRV